MVAFALVALLVICVVAVLYVAKAFFLPVVTAFVVGTMLSPAAGFLERHRIPRAVSAVLIVTAVGAGVAFMVGLISSPLMEWSTRLPELGSLLKDKLHIFDRPLALWQELQSMLGVSDTLVVPFQMPKFDWVQPTLEFLSPTFTEFLLFFATLVLFIASWRDLRRALIMTFADHAARLRTLRILNEIEGQLGGYLLTVTMINLGVGTATGIICAVTGMPNPAGLGALAATLNFFPIIGPVAMFVILTVVGVIAFSTLGAGPDRSAGVCRADFSRRTFCHADHHRSPARTQRIGGVHGAGVLDLAVGTDGRLSVVAAFDRGPHSQGASDAGGFAAAAAGLTGFSPAELPATRSVCARAKPGIQELLMSSTDGEAGMRNLTDKATYERLEKDVAAVKNDISALTDQITDALNTFAGTAGKQARRGYKQARANVDSAVDDISERGSAMMDAAQDAASSIEESLEDVIHAAPAGDRRPRARPWLPDRRRRGAADGPRWAHDGGFDGINSLVRMAAQMRRHFVCRHSDFLQSRRFRCFSA